MGRTPSVNRHLPPQMRARRRGEKVYYYYDTGGKPRHEIPLGDDYTIAVQMWAQLDKSKPTVAMTVAWAVQKYTESKGFNDLGKGTQDDYGFALDKIVEHFGDAPLGEVRPAHITLYMDKRSLVSKHRALRERAVFSMLFNWCIAREFCTFNPAGVIKTKRLPGRKHVYIHDEMLDAVYEKSPQDLKDAIDLAYFIGQRPADVLSMTLVKIRDGFLEYRQGKTKTPQRVAINADLAALLARIEERKATHKVHSLFLLVNERGAKMTKSMLRSRFEAARAEAKIAGKDFQFRDLRRKSGSDLRDQKGLDAAQDLLGHLSQAQTEHYTGARGKKISAIPRKASNGAVDK